MALNWKPLGSFNDRVYQTLRAFESAHPASPMRKRIFQDLPSILTQFSLMAVLMVMLSTASACAQSPATQATSSTATDTKAALQPYLGKWRPTSFQRELNIGSLAITDNRLSMEFGGSVTYELVKKTDKGVIVRVTGRQPANTHPEVTAFGFSLETETVTGPPPARITKTREILRICYGFGDLDYATGQLVSEMKGRRCPYTHTR